MTMLSQHFSLAEMTTTGTGIYNQPANSAHMNNLRASAMLMERVRDLLGGLPIKVNSAYRSPAVNTAVRGSSTSAHCLGWAVDFVCPAFGSPYEVCKTLANSDLVFDQLILEKARWTHIGFGPRSRRQILTLLPSGTRYLPGLIR